MSLSDRDKLEIRQVLQQALEPELEKLRRDIVLGIVEMLDQIEAILMANTRDMAEKWRVERDARAKKSGIAGFLKR